MNIEIACVPTFRLAGGDRMRRRAAGERHFDVLCEAMDTEEPALTLDSVQRRVPFDRLAYARDGPHDDGVETKPDVAFPPGMAAR